MLNPWRWNTMFPSACRVVCASQMRVSSLFANSLVIHKALLLVQEVIRLDTITLPLSICVMTLSPRATAPAWCEQMWLRSHGEACVLIYEVTGRCYEMCHGISHNSKIILSTWPNVSELFAGAYQWGIQWHSGQHDCSALSIVYRICPDMLENPKWLL